MLTPDQLASFYPDLSDERVDSAIALVHSRFSTNTFPSWPLAHPYRLIAHNGEINTIRGNRNWMQAREALLRTPTCPGQHPPGLPGLHPGASDSANFDEVLELLHLAGRSLPHAVLMMIPEAWENDPAWTPSGAPSTASTRSLMEPWDGPASRGVHRRPGCRRGAGPQRAAPGPLVAHRRRAGRARQRGRRARRRPGTVVAKGRLQPGRMFLVDTVAGRIIDDDEIKKELSAAASYGDWLHAGLMHLDTCPPGSTSSTPMTRCSAASRRSATPKRS